MNIITFAPMLRIVAHIERLLWTQDCVILPGWGGFVRQTQSAVYDGATHTFSPAHKELMFNATLRHTDGLLTEAYRKAYGVDYPQAQLLVEEDLQALRCQLQAERQVRLGRLGVLSLGEEEQLIFTPGDEAWLNADSYGLIPFTLMPLPLLEEQPASAVSAQAPIRQREVYYIPIHRRVLQGLTGAAAAVLLFFCTSTPVTEVSRNAYTASFMPTEITTSLRDANEVPASVPFTSGREALQPVEITTSVEVAQVQPEAERAIVPEVKTQEAPAKKMYHLVIASFPTEAQADEFMGAVDLRQYSQMGKVTRGGKCRVYAARFDNRAEAERQLALLRQNNRYKDAWLFISK